MSRTFNDDMRWQNRFMPQIKQILGQCLICEAPAEEDQQRNTDLLVLRLDTVRVACRMRKHDMLLKYPNDFTIRMGRPSGAKTELAKLLEGWGDYFFYGFSNQDETQVCKWLLGDLKVFRLWFFRELYKMPPKRLPGYLKKNHDNSSDFLVFNIDAMPTNFLISSSDIEW